MDMNFDLGQLLTEDEMDDIMNGSQEVVAQEIAGEDTPDDIDNNDDVPENVDEGDNPQEKVDTEDIEEKGDTADKGGDSSPTVFTSIADAFRKDGIFPDFDDETISNVKTADDLAELVEKAIQSRFDETSKRILDALNNGVEPSKIKQYEQTLNYLGSINEDVINNESEEGMEIRKQLIYNDLLVRGYSKERAERAIENSIKSGTDIDDAKDALASLISHYSSEYKGIQDDARRQVEEASEKRKKDAEDFRKMVIDDELKFGSTVLDKRTKQRVFDAVSKPVYKDPKTGKMLTQIQQFQKEHPMEFLKQLGMWFVLTDGGKNPAGIVKKQVNIEKNKNIKELERKINGTMLNSDGSLRYTGDNSPEGKDILLSNDWQIG